MSLLPELQEILDRRTEAAGSAPRKFSCDICQDQGAVFVQRRSESGREELRIARCTCDQPAGKGYFPRQKENLDRYWDREIPSILELGISAQDVFPLTYGQQFQSDQVETRAERDAIQAAQMGDE